MMTKKTETKNRSSVDKVLSAMFLKISSEECLRTNGNAVHAILELRNAYQQQQFKRPGPLGQAIYSLCATILDV